MKGREWLMMISDLIASCSVFSPGMIEKNGEKKSSKQSVIFFCHVFSSSSTEGNAAACSTALAVMEVIEDEQLRQHAKRVGDYFLQGLLKLKDRHQQIGDVRWVQTQCVKKSHWWMKTDADEWKITLLNENWCGWMKNHTSQRKLMRMSGNWHLWMKNHTGEWKLMRMVFISEAKDYSWASKLCQTWKNGFRTRWRLVS